MKLLLVHDDFSDERAIGCLRDVQDEQPIRIALGVGELIQTARQMEQTRKTVDAFMEPILKALEPAGRKS